MKIFTQHLFSNYYFFNESLISQIITNFTISIITSIIHFCLFVMLCEIEYPRKGLVLFSFIGLIELIKYPV